MGETVGPPQEDTGANEPTGRHDRTSPAHWFRDRRLSISLTAALSAAIPLQHERLTAAEIPPASTWMEGIHKLYRGARSDSVETVGVFAIDNQTRRGKWIFGKEGLPMTVDFSPKDLGTIAANEFSDTSTKSVTLCGLHTHPVSSGEASNFITENVPTKDWQPIREGRKYISFPPSMDDISPSSIDQWQASVQKLNENGIAADMRFGVIDNAGVTYYQLITEEKLQQEYPAYFRNLQHRIALSESWEKTLNPILKTLDDATLDRLHPLAFRNVLYDTPIAEYASSNNPEIQIMKHNDLKQGLSDKFHREDIARELLAQNPQAQKTYRDYVTQVLEKEEKDEDLFYEAAANWIKTSLTINPDQWPISEQYEKLREAYARNGASIRFVPLQRVADEPPCAGAEYTP